MFTLAVKAFGWLRVTCTGSDQGAEGGSAWFHWDPPIRHLPQQPDQPSLNRHARSFVAKLLLRSHVGPLFYMQYLLVCNPLLRGLISIFSPAQFGITGLVTRAEEKARYTSIVYISARRSLPHLRSLSLSPVAPALSFTFPCRFSLCSLHFYKLCQLRALWKLPILLLLLFCPRDELLLRLH